MALRIQIDAAVNPGNSGGPALVGDKMIGLVNSGIRGADNIGYIIPSEEVDLFLNDIGDGKYDGKPMIRDQLQTLENDALRTMPRLQQEVGRLRGPRARLQLPTHTHSRSGTSSPRLATTRSTTSS